MESTRWTFPVKESRLETVIMRRLTRTGRLFAFLMSPPANPEAGPRLVNWLGLLEREPPLRQRFRESWLLLLREVDAEQRSGSRWYLDERD